MKVRKLNRKRDYDYSQDGWYFVTISIKRNGIFFGEIRDGEMLLNDVGKIVEERWLWLGTQYSYVVLDEFIIMPDHMHGILEINSVGTGRDLSLQQSDMPVQKIKSLSELIGAFKTTSSKLIHQKGILKFAWHRSFHDRIIRNEREYINIKNYIINNPINQGVSSNL